MNDFLSQEEIDALLKASDDINESSDELQSSNTSKEDVLSAMEVDALGEVGNISMATAATTLSTLLSKSVDITTPSVSITTFQKLVDGFQTPFVALQVQFAGELTGTNVLVIGIREAVIIARLMMMQEVDSDFNTEEIGEMELSAVSEAMNQMIGSASTAISTMLGKFIDIAPPVTSVGRGNEVDLSLLDINEEIVQIEFKMTIEDLVDSNIMQVFSLNSAKAIVKSMMGGFEEPAPSADTQEVVEEMPAVQDVAQEPVPGPVQQPMQQPPMQQPVYEQPMQQPMYGQPMQPPPMQQPVYEQPMQQPMYGQPMQPQPMQQPGYEQPYMMTQKPQFVPLTKIQRPNQPKNIELILDVPMEMSVVLGRAQRSVKQILSLGPGSVIELNKYAEEPLDIFVNGMLVGQGEVVVIEEKFGIRVNSIVSTKERAESLGANHK